MSGRPSATPPAWATNGASVMLEPSSGKKATGWATDDRPPAKNFNWFWGIAYQWLSYFAEIQIKNWIKGTGGTVTDNVTAIASCPTIASPDFEHTIVAVSSSVGDVAYSKDEGISWTVVTAGTAGLLWDVCSTDDVSNPVFVAVGSGGKIVSSADGESWTDRTSGVSAALNAVCWDATNSKFIAVGDTGTVVTSPDGTTWTDKTSASGTTQNLYAVGAQPNGHVKACGSAQTIIRSTDGGATWTADTPAGSSATYAAVHFNATLGWRMVSDNGVVHSCDEDGTSWTQLAATGLTFSRRSLVSDGGHMWLAQDDRSPVYSTDGCLTWSTIPLSIENADNYVYNAIDYTRDAFWIAQSERIYRSLRL